MKYGLENIYVMGCLDMAFLTRSSKEGVSL